MARQTTLDLAIDHILRARRELKAGRPDSADILLMTATAILHGKLTTKTSARSAHETAERTHQRLQSYQDSAEATS